MSGIRLQMAVVVVRSSVMKLSITLDLIRSAGHRCERSIYKHRCVNMDFFLFINAC